MIASIYPDSPLYPFKSQYLQTNSPNWSLYISLKNELREFVKRSRHFYLGDHFINSHNLSVDNVWILLGENWSWSLLGLKGLFGWCTTYQVNSKSRVMSQRTQQWSLALKQWHNKLARKEWHKYSACTVYWLGILSITPLLQSTPNNSNLAQTRTKIDFPWISFINYVHLL